MPYGDVIGHIDVAQITLYAFWFFFAGLLYYLRREDRREGFPLESEITGRVEDPGPLWLPEPKEFNLPHGGTYLAPQPSTGPRQTHLPVRPYAKFPGAPIEPTGDPMKDGIGPASYANRRDEPDLTLEGTPRIVPLRVVEGHSIDENDANPIGMPVFGADGIKVGTIKDLWIDLTETQIRYYEVELNDGSRTVLMPSAFGDISGLMHKVKVEILMAKHFANIPAIKSPDQITKLEEDKIMGYFAGGTLYATPQRAEPLL